MKYGNQLEQQNLINILKKLIYIEKIKFNNYIIKHVKL